MVRTACRGDAARLAQEVSVQGAETSTLLTGIRNGWARFTSRRVEGKGGKPTRTRLLRGSSSGGSRSGVHTYNVCAPETTPAGSGARGRGRGGGRWGRACQRGDFWPDGGQGGGTRGWVHAKVRAAANWERQRLRQDARLVSIWKGCRGSVCGQLGACRRGQRPPCRTYLSAHAAAAAKQISPIAKRGFKKAPIRNRRSDDPAAAARRVVGGATAPLDVGTLTLLGPADSGGGGAAACAPARGGVRGRPDGRGGQQQLVGEGRRRFFLNVASCGVGAGAARLAERYKWAWPLCEFRARLSFSLGQGRAPTRLGAARPPTWRCCQ